MTISERLKLFRSQNDRPFEPDLAFSRESRPGDPEDIRCMPSCKQAERLRDETAAEICGDRRARRRYPLELEMAYRIVADGRVCQAGGGRTLDISGMGIAFRSEEVLKAGSSVEVTIAWPILLHKTCPLKLAITGKVVRSGRGVTAVRMQRYEFRTKGQNSLRTMAAGSAFQN
jgi:hypothetical protein